LILQLGQNLLFGASSVNFVARMVNFSPLEQVIFVSNSRLIKLGAFADLEVDIVKLGPYKETFTDNFRKYTDTKNTQKRNIIIVNGGFLK
jgi:hypothetical protein